LAYVWLGTAAAAAGLVLFFALAHAALSRFSRARLEERFEQHHRLDALHRLFAHHDELLRATGLLHVASLVALTILVVLWAHDRLGGGPAAWTLGAGLALAAGLLFGLLIPVAWARYAAESVLAAVLPACHACRLLLSPMRGLCNLVDDVVRRLAGARPGPRALSYIEEEIRSVVTEGEREGAIAEDQVEMIEGIIEFKKSVVSQVMTPRTDIVSIEAGADVEEARDLVARTGHSRIPVTRGNIDTIVGILYAKDLLSRACDRAAADTLRVKDVMRPPVFVPETKRLDELLVEFQGEQVHMAVVLDEYGGTAGLVTIEDLIEEIVGEISDEYEREPPKAVRPVGERAYEVEARVHIDELNDELALHLPENGDYETIGGFVLSRLGYIPKTGETLQFEGLRISVLAAEPRRVTRLRLDLPAPAETPGGP